MTEPTQAPEISFDHAWDEADVAEGVKPGAITTPDEPAEAAPVAAPAAAAPAPVPAAAPAPVTDEEDGAFWNEIPEAVRGKVKERFDTEHAAREAAEHRARSDSNRVSALQRKSDALARQLATATPSPDLLSAALAGGGDQWKQLEQDFPAIAGPLKAVLGSALKVSTEQTQQAITPVVAKLVQNDQDEAFAELARVHPAWQQTVNTPAFSAWMQKQAPGVQALADSDHAADAAALLNQFVAATKSPAAPAPQGQPPGDSVVVDIKKQRAQRVAQAAATPVVSAAAPTGRADIPDEWDAAWTEYDRRDASVKK